MKKEEYVYKVFQTVADGYDAANERISLHRHMKWKRRAARSCCAGTENACSILDVGCGTGDMLRLLHEERPEAKLTGLDFSPNMLREAEKNLADIDALRLIEGDAMHLPFEDALFDCAVISFALRNTADYAQVLSEMVRVVRPGGRICVIDSFIPECRLIRPAYGFYFSAIMPLLGGGIKRYKQYRWLSRSTKDFVPASGLQSLMAGQGMEEINRKDFMFGACVCVTGRKRS